MRFTFWDVVCLSIAGILVLLIGYMLYAAQTGQFETHKDWVYSVDSNSDGLLVSASENELVLWDGRSCVGRLVRHNHAVKSVAFSHNDQFIVSGGIDSSVIIWSSGTKETQKILLQHTKGVNKVEFSNSDKCVVSAGYDGKLFVWDWKEGKAVKAFDVKHTDFSISKRDVLAFVDTNCVLTFFDLQRFAIVKTLDGYCGMPVFSPKEDIIAVHDSVFRIVDLRTSKVISVFDARKVGSIRTVMTFEFTPDGQYVVAAFLGDPVEIWNWKTKKLYKSLQASIWRSAECITFSLQGDLIAGSGDRSISVWDWRRGKLKRVMGDGEFRMQLFGLLSIFVLLTLVTGFWVLAKGGGTSFSDYIILAILSVWSFGVALLLYFFGSAMERVAMVFIWVSTCMSVLFFLSVYGSGLALISIPVALIFCYLKLISGSGNKTLVGLLVVNLVFCGVLSSFILFAGLWK